MRDISLAEGPDEVDFSKVHVVEVNGERGAFRGNADHERLTAGLSGVDAGGDEFWFAHRFSCYAEAASLVCHIGDDF